MNRQLMNYDITKRVVISLRDFVLEGRNLNDILGIEFLFDLL